mgnify:CR=1 FL=1
MGNFDTTKAAIKNVIKENNNQEITGTVLQDVLINILNNIGVGYIFGGIATTTTKPESITGTNAPVYYIANEIGTYVNFDNIVVNKNEFALLLNGADKKWRKAFVNIADFAGSSVQTGVKGNINNYVYSNGTIYDIEKSVSSMKFDIIKNDGKCIIRHFFWGRTEGDGNYISKIIPTANSSSDGAMSKETYNTLATQVTKNSEQDDAINKIRSTLNNVNQVVDELGYINLGNFDSEQDALNKLSEISICGNIKISNARLTYGFYASILMSQCIENDYCRQIIINKTNVYQRAIYFADSNRTTIAFIENWSLFTGDRLKWDSSSNKYTLSQFESEAINKEHTDPIPTANSSSDGLMSKETYNTLATQVTKNSEQDDAINKIRSTLLAVAHVIYVDDIELQRITVDRYPSTSEDYKTGQPLRIYSTQGKDIPSTVVKPNKYGIWFGAYLGLTAGFKRYNTESVCGITSEDLYNLTPTNYALQDYIFFDNTNKKYTNLYKGTDGLFAQSNSKLDVLLKADDIIKLSK